MLYIFFQLATLALLFIKTVDRPTVFILFSIFLIFVLLTKEGSWDYFGYIKLYECLVDPSCAHIGVESSFKYIGLAANFSFDDIGFYAVIFFYCALSLAIKFTVIKRHSKWIGVALLVYASHSLYIHEMTQIRASVAIGFSWLAYSAFSENKLTKTIVFIAIGSLFHISALLAILVIASSKINIRLLIAACIISIPFGTALEIIGLPNIPDLPIERVNTYLDAMGSVALTAPQFNIYVLVQVALLLMLLSRRYRFSNFEILAIKSSLIGLIIYFSFYFIPVIPLRVLEFMASLHPFLAAYIFATSRSILKRIFLVLLFIGLWVNLAIRNNTRADLVFNWQIINESYMSDFQIHQFHYLNP